GVTFGRVLAMVAVDLVKLLGLRVVRLHVVVGDRPGRRDPVMVPELPEVLRPQAVERRAVHLGRSADRVVDPGLGRLVRLVGPGLLGHVPVLDEDLLRVPVLRLAWQPVAALEDEDALARRGEMAGEGAAAGPAA